jgi:hypothetical protein
VLGIAVLIGALAVTAIVVLVSQAGDDIRATPLRDDTKKPQQRSQQGQEAGPSVPSVVTLSPRSRSRSTARRGARERSRRARNRRHAAGTGGSPLAVRDVRNDDRPRHSRPWNPEPPKGRAVPPSPPALPAPAHGPPSLSTPAAPAGPAPPKHAGPQPSNTPETVPAPKPHPVEIAIEDGELESELDRVHPIDGHIRLRIRSDQLVIVEVESHKLSQTVRAGGEALIEFDTLSRKSFKLELRRRKDVLVLRVRD